MKVYVVEPSFENTDAGPECRHVFTRKRDAQQFFVNTFVKSWFDKYPEKKVTDYFRFNPFKNNLSQDEFLDIKRTFYQSGEIHHVNMD